MDDSNMQQTVFCEKECPIEPPASKKRKIQSQNKHRTIQSKKAKALELVSGKSPEVSEIDQQKQTVQTYVLTELHLVKEKLRKWDEAFVREYGRLPNNNDYMSSTPSCDRFGCHGE